MSKTNDQVAHLWAQQNKDSGKNGNGSLSFSGPHIYSYSTMVGRFYGEKVILTSKSYSHTTQNHLSAIRSAVTHRQVFYFYGNVGSLPSEFEEAIKSVFDSSFLSVNNAVSTITRARSNILWLLQRLRTDWIKARDIYRDYIEEKDPSYWPQVATVIIPQETFLNTAFDAYNEADHLHEIQAALYGLGIDVAPKLIKEREKEAKRWAKEEEWAALQKLAETEKLQRWLTDTSFSYSFYLSEVYLRVNGENLETSRGAKVPLREALEVYQNVLSGGTVAGKRVGHFTVDALTDDALIVGCHTIPLDEMHRLGKQLKMIP